MPLDVAYSKLSHEEHVLELPDTYVGDTESNTTKYGVMIIFLIK